MTGSVPRSLSPHAGLVIALHCSGAGAGQWRQLGDALAPHFDLRAPEHFGTESAGPWCGEHAFTLADEAAATIGLIDAMDGKVHLVGHSYGGGVALRVALERAHRIASLTLYEPSAFYLLAGLGEAGAEARKEIMGVVRTTAEGVVTGDYASAARHFVDYWNGPGAWNALRPDIQAALTRWLPKAPLDFRALLDEPTPLSAYRDFGFPVLVLRGEHAPPPTRVAAEALADAIPSARLITIAGAGHMGPITHAAEVNRHVVDHIAEAAGMDGHAGTIAA
jgi:pimeloyl-ACP methyl ester carboxylesterase